MEHRIRKIISGGQTGADQAALDAAIEAGCAHGGWLPKGRKTENGPLPLSYRLEEMKSSNYRHRTAKNVREADGTLLVTHGELSGGTLLTRVFAEKYGKPWLHIDCSRQSAEEAHALCRKWLGENAVAVLNVAGPRASGDPDIYTAVKRLVDRLLTGGKEK